MEQPTNKVSLFLSMYTVIFSFLELNKVSLVLHKYLPQSKTQHCSLFPLTVVNLFQMVFLNI